MQTSSSVCTACNYKGIRCVAFSCVTAKISLIFVNAIKCNAKYLQEVYIERYPDL